MPGKIPPEFIDRLLERIDIVELINTKVTLKKAGNNYVACCPFHAEKTPSFTVSPNKQFYYCFGCRASGSAIGFLMNYEHLTFREAIENLATRASMPLPQTHVGTDYHEIDLSANYAILTMADKWFRRQLRTDPNAAQAVAYLKSRGLTGKIAAEYGIGYAPAGWDNLLKAVEEDDSAVLQLLQNGLVVENSGNRHDRFRNRIMFPIRDRRGRTIGFGGRVLGDEKPKYLNSPETPLFHKSQELYGIFEMTQALRRIEQILIVEGYMDVIALAQFGIRYAVATLGTTTTTAHLETLFRLCNRLTFCFDGDKAGKDAAWKAVNTILPMASEQREIRFLFLPDGEDPDTFVRKIGATAFAQHLQSAHPLSDVIFERLGANLDLTSLDGRAHLASQARTLVARMPAGIYHDMMLARLEQLTGLPANNIGLPNPRKTSRKNYAINNKTPMPLVQRAVAILLQNPHLGRLPIPIPDDWQRLQQPNTKPLAELFAMLQASSTVLSTAALIERWRDTPQFEELQFLAQHNLKEANEDLQAELLGALQRLNVLAQSQESPLPQNQHLPSTMTEEQKAAWRNLVVRKE